MATAVASERDVGASGLVRAREWPLRLFACALPLGLAARLCGGWGLPLWMDEVFSGTIAGQRDLAGLIRWCLSELTGPAFYAPLWLWAKLFGTSDAALRAPPMLFALATPLLVAWRGHPERSIRLLWAALILLWLPIIPMASEARAYPQLFFLTTAQAMLFVPLMRAPGALTAWGWAAVSACAILTHYYALPITGLQGIALIVGHRGRMLRLAPALLPFAVAGVWMAFHLRFLLTYASGYLANYNAMPAVMALAFPIFLFGPGIQGFFALGMIAITARAWWREVQWRSPEAILVMTGVIAFALLIVCGLIRATLMPRYLTPAIPAILFGIACWAQRLRAREAVPVALLFASLFAAMAVAMVGGSDDLRYRERRHFEFETASTWLAERQPERLHFLWSTSVGAQSDSDYLREIAGFFFARAGNPVEVVVSRGGNDPSRALITAAGDDPSAALLWLSDNRLPKGVVPRVAGVDARWECRDFGGDGVLVYACRRRSLSARP